MISRLLALFLAILITIWLISSCMTDPLGMTTRTSIRSQTDVQTIQMETSANMHIAEVDAEAKIRVAEAESQARVHVAEAESQAKVQVAEEMADAAKVQAKEQRRVHQVWAYTAQMLLAIASIAGCIGLALLLCTKIVLQLMKDGLNANVFINLVTSEPNIEPKHLSSPAEDTLAKYAAQHNQYVRRQNGLHLLVDRDTNEIVRRFVQK